MPLIKMNFGLSCTRTAPNGAFTNPERTTNSSGGCSEGSVRHWASIISEPKRVRIDRATGIVYCPLQFRIRGRTESLGLLHASPHQAIGRRLRHTGGTKRPA